jgi:hypothetical protein
VCSLAHGDARGVLLVECVLLVEGVNKGGSAGGALLAERLGAAVRVVLVEGGSANRGGCCVRVEMIAR